MKSSRYADLVLDRGVPSLERHFFDMNECRSCLGFLVMISRTSPWRYRVADWKLGRVAAVAGEEAVPGFLQMEFQVRGAFLELASPTG